MGQQSASPASRLTTRDEKLQCMPNRPAGISIRLQALPPIYVKLLPAPVTGTSFSGTISYDECAHSTIPIGDVGCSITVTIVQTVYTPTIVAAAPRVVTIAHVTGRLAPGPAIGFSSLTTDYTGRRVSVYAKQTSGNNYTLAGSKSYYAKLLPAVVAPQPVPLAK